VNDPLVVNYVMKSQLPEEWKERTAQKRETEKRNVTRRAAKFQQIQDQSTVPGETPTSKTQSVARSPHVQAGLKQATKGSHSKAGP
jgi:hypothetical protein